MEILHNGFDGDIIQRVDRAEGGGDAAADRIDGIEDFVDRREKVGVFFPFLLHFPQKRRADHEILFFDGFVQPIGRVHTEERDADDEMGIAERLRQIVLDQIGFPAAPFPGEQKRPQMLFFAAVSNQFV